MAEDSKKTAEVRKELLAKAIQTQVVSGSRIESQSDFQAILIKGHRVNHALHAIVGLFTLGTWWLVWLILVIAGGEKRHIVSVDEYGNTLVQKV